MSDVQAAEAETATEENTDERKAPSGGRKLRGKVLVVYIVLPLLMLGGGGYFALSYFGIFGSRDTVQSASSEEPKKITFFDLPEMLVNLNTQDGRAKFLKLKISLEMTDDSAKYALSPLLPRILDTFQVYLRELRAEDLGGSAGVYRLKEELMRRVNLAIRPKKIDRVLFKEMLVQ